MAIYISVHILQYRSTDTFQAYEYAKHMPHLIFQISSSNEYCTGSKNAPVRQGHSSPGSIRSYFNGIQQLR